MSHYQTIVRSQPSVLETNKVLRNTYALLSMTLFFSAATAGLSMTLNLPHPGAIVTLVAFLAGLASLFIPMQGLHIAVSAMFIMLMSGWILFETSNIIHGGETNYILATVSLDVSIFNLFTSLLQLLGIFGGDD